jgi:hypothetical protein
MLGRDQKKLTTAGYTLIRSDDSPSPRIKYKDAKHHEWTTLQKDFESKAARDRRMDELLKDPMIIQD